MEEVRGRLDVIVEELTIKILDRPTTAVFDIRLGSYDGKINQCEATNTKIKEFVNKMRKDLNSELDEI
jgi:hypothetical protein